MPSLTCERMPLLCAMGLFGWGCLLPRSELLAWRSESVLPGVALVVVVACEMCVRGGAD